MMVGGFYTGYREDVQHGNALKRSRVKPNLFLKRLRTEY